MSKKDDNNDPLAPVSDFLSLADRTIASASHMLSELAHTGDVDDTIASRLPSLLRSGPHTFFNGISNTDDDRMGGLSDVETKLGLDERKPNDELWAYPVPSVKQYEACRELEQTQGAIGVWTREGVWRCLFPKNKRQFEANLALPLVGSGTQEKEKDERYVFGDYRAFLDWKSGFRRAMLAQRRRERELESAWTNPNTLTTTTTTGGSEEDGKKVVATSIHTETYTTSAGAVETKRTVKTTFADGTTKLTETTSNSADSADQGKLGGGDWTSGAAKRLKDFAGETREKAGEVQKTAEGKVWDAKRDVEEKANGAWKWIWSDGSDKK